MFMEVKSLICGKCAQKYNLSLDDRIEIAQARVNRQMYQCDRCGAHHMKVEFMPYTHSGVSDNEEIK
jgi:RNase P subunit RPR2